MKESYMWRIRCCDGGNEVIWESVAEGRFWEAVKRGEMVAQILAYSRGCSVDLGSVEQVRRTVGVGGVNVQQSCRMP